MEPYVLDFEDTGERKHFDGSVGIAQVRVFCTCGYDDMHNGVFSAWAMGDIHARRHLMHSEPVTVMMDDGPKTFHTKEEYDKEKA